MKRMIGLWALLFPPKCVLCGKILRDGETDLCKECRVEAPLCPNGKRKPQFLDSFVAVWYYEESIRKSLLRYKFYGRRSYAAAYGRLLAMELLQAFPEGFDVLTWIPVSRLRRLRRGYDQVELIAKAVGKELGIRPVPTLKKIRSNPPQSGITGEAQRKANVMGVYAVRADAQVNGKTVVLLDDILTTGATMGEAARTLRTAGAEQVHGAAVAAARK